MRPRLDPERVASREVTQKAIDILFILQGELERQRQRIQEAIESIQETCTHSRIIGRKGNLICKFCAKGISEKEKRERKKKK